VFQVRRSWFSVRGSWFVVRVLGSVRESVPISGSRTGTLNPEPRTENDEPRTTNLEPIGGS
jgi:hypothetical protein